MASTIEHFPLEPVFSLNNVQFLFYFFKILICVIYPCKNGLETCFEQVGFTFESLSVVMCFVISRIFEDGTANVHSAKNKLFKLDKQVFFNAPSYLM
jgi:hypothetical protein